MILQRLVGVAKPYRKYFRLRAENHFSIFHSLLRSHLRSKIIRINWKFGQRCKMSQIIIIYKKISENFPPTQNVFFFALRANLWFDFSEIKQGLHNFAGKKVIRKYSAEQSKSTRCWIFLLIKVEFYWWDYSRLFASQRRTFLDKSIDGSANRLNFHHLSKKTKCFNDKLGF